MSACLIQKTLFPKIPIEVLDYFRETEDSIYQVFFHMFSLNTCPDVAFGELDQIFSGLAPVDNPTVGASGQRDQYSDYLTELVYRYVEFCQNMTRPFGFVTDVSETSPLLATVEVQQVTKNDVMVNFEWDTTI